MKFPDQRVGSHREQFGPVLGPRRAEFEQFAGEVGFEVGRFHSNIFAGFRLPWRGPTVRFKRMARMPKNSIPKTPAPPDLPERLEDLLPISVEDLRSGRPLEDVRMRDADISGSVLAALAVRGAFFERLSLANCTAASCHWRDIRLMNCDLSNAVLRGFEANRVEFIDCRLIGMRAFECTWQDVLIENCDARYAQFTDGKVRGCEFRGTRMEEADFRSTGLELTIFREVDLKRGDLRGANLDGTDLRGAAIEAVLVNAADVRGAIVSPAQAIDLVRLLEMVIR
jgi:uncharacterized protein YjbI with pentapeptide repeats